MHMQYGSQLFCMTSVVKLEAVECRSCKSSFCRPYVRQAAPRHGLVVIWSGLRADLSRVVDNLIDDLGRLPRYRMERATSVYVLYLYLYCCLGAQVG